MNIQLRDYQKEMLQRLQHAWEKYQSVMVQMPTGTGKTYLMAEIIRNAESGSAVGWQLKNENAQGANRVLIVAHRVELIEQISRTLDVFGVEHGVIDRRTRDIEEVTREHQVCVASIQTLSRRIGRTGDTGSTDFSLVIVDEAHHALAKTYKVMWDWWPKAKFLGLTATPCRLSGEPFTDLFDVQLQSWSVRDFISKGWLSDLDYISVKSDSQAIMKVAGLVKRGTDGDYQTLEAALVLDTEESIEHLYQSYKEYANGKKGIVYAINREHAHHIAEYYMKKGVRCVVVDCKMPAKERKEIVEDYKRTFDHESHASDEYTGRRIDVIVNVDVFSEGFDVPEVEFIQLARPTLSLAKYLQQLGRGMRISKGKDKVMILDQVGSYLIFGTPTIERDWQRMFLGEIKGKGTPLSLYRVSELEMVVNKMLVNEEMVRLTDYERMMDELLMERRQQNIELAKSYQEERYGNITIFKEKGLYGIKVGRKVTCPAAFTSIERLDKNRKYLALATLPRSMSGNVETRTVINMDGEDLHARLRGTFIREKDDLFEMRTTEQGRYVTLCWDARSDSYYENAHITDVAGLTFLMTAPGEYRLRTNTDYIGRFTMREVLYNEHLVIIGNDLFVKAEMPLHYHIEGFLEDSIIVREDGRDDYCLMTSDGETGERLKTVPERMTARPQMRRLKLYRKETRGTIGRDIDDRLRDYQYVQKSSLESSLWRGWRILLQTPTGTGKCMIAAWAIRYEMRTRKANPYAYMPCVLIVAHRPEVIPQIVQELDRFGFTHVVTMEQGNRSHMDTGITVVCKQQLRDFMTSVSSNYEPTLIMIDEAHHASQEEYERLWHYWPAAKILGLTATPCSTDNKKLKGVFEKLVASDSLKSFIDERRLKEVEVVEDQQTGDDRTDITEVAATLYRAYQQHAEGRKGIVFAAHERMAMEIARYYTQQGTKAAFIDFGMPEDEREWMISDYELGTIKVLVCVDYFSDGMRGPDADFVQLARPTDSLCDYLHQVGCAMHPDHGHGTQQTLRVIDHAGLTRKFGHPTEERNWRKLFSGERKVLTTSEQKVVIIKREETHTSAARTANKWQQRMQRLLENVETTRQ